MGTKQLAIADTHFDHGPGILQIRPQFKSVREHDAFILDSINSVANKHDTLLLLGDIGINEGSYALLSQITCLNVILVPGNHCGERSIIDHSVFKRVMGAYTRRLPHSRLEAVFTHIPVHPQCLDRWDINIHGHLHDQVIVDDPRYFCVSCEALDYKPIDMETIFYSLLARRTIHGGTLDLPDWKFEK